MQLGYHKSGFTSDLIQKAVQGSLKFHDSKASQAKKAKHSKAGIHSEIRHSGSQSAREFTRVRSESGEDPFATPPIVTRRRRGTLTSSLESLAIISKIAKHEKHKKEKGGKEKEKDNETERTEDGKGEEEGMDWQHRDVVKDKARSDSSLMISFSRKLIERSGLSKSSSLIDLKPPPVIIAPTSKSGSFAFQSGKPISRSGYFGVRLEEAMDMQREKYPNLTIPIILVKLTGDIIRYDGCRTEGIFRVAGSSQQVHKLQQQYNDMNFDDTSSDPHVLVGVMKQWLRELKDPLVPNSLYYECLESDSTEECLAAIEKMPSLNKDSFGHLVRFVRQIARPENLEYTKMDVHNLCIVFAPVMFRCPSTDMAELMVNLQKEKLFFAQIVESPSIFP